MLTRDRAFIHEPRGDSDMFDRIEFDRARLLEMRHDDELLDDELPRMHDLVETARHSVDLLAARRWLAVRWRMTGAAVSNPPRRVIGEGLRFVKGPRGTEIAVTAQAFERYLILYPLGPAWIS